MASVILAFFLGMAGWARPAHAVDAPDGTRRWSIWRDGDKVGDYTATFRHQDGLLIVESSISIVPRLLTIAVARYKHTARETWQGGRLLALDASTNRDGAKSRLAARATAGGLSVEGPAGSFVVLTAVYPSSLWCEDMTRADRLLDIDRGRLLAVHATVGAEEPLALGDRTDVPARHVTLAGDLPRDLWYGKDGILLRVQYRDDNGSLVEYQAQLPR